MIANFSVVAPHVFSFSLQLYDCHTQKEHKGMKQI